MFAPGADLLDLASPRGDVERSPSAEVLHSTIDAARFETRSIASAASTLGAEALSQSAVALESAFFDLSDSQKIAAALDKLKLDFVQLSAFINSNTSSKTKTSVQVAASAVAESATDRGKDAAPEQNLHQMMHDQLFESWTST